MDSLASFASPQDIMEKRLCEVEGQFQRLSSRLDSKVSQQLSKNTFKGTALMEGTWNSLYYPAEELEKSYKSLIGKPLTIEHDDGFPNIVGSVKDAFFKDKSIIVTFEVFDNSTIDRLSYLVERGIHPGLSVEVFEDRVEENGKVVCKNLEFCKLSITMTPACDACQVISKLKKKGENMSEEQEEKTKAKAETQNEEKPEVMCLVPEEKLADYYPGYPRVKYYPAKYPGGWFKYPEFKKILDEILKRLDAIEGKLSETSEEEETEEEETEPEKNPEVEELKKKVAELEKEVSKPKETETKETADDVSELKKTDPATLILREKE